MLATGQAVVGNHVEHDRRWTLLLKIGTGGKFAIDVQSAALREAYPASWRATLREWRSYPRKPTIPGGYKTVSNVPQHKVAALQPAARGQEVRGR